MINSIKDRIKAPCIEWKIAGISVGVFYIILSAIHLLHVGIDILPNCKCNMFSAIVITVNIFWIAGVFLVNLNPKFIFKIFFLLKIRLKCEKCSFNRMK